ncbi:MAG: tyrosine-type recombinase/integrase [Planctomycetes bacterium]|nr:tyrosine-type recombinase/integrase [Planctomycetota bacterium]
MQDAIDAFLRRGQVQGWSPATVRSYGAILADLAGFLRRRGCRGLPEVMPADLDAFMEYLRDDGRAKTSRVQAAAVSRRFFRWLHEDGRIATNPARAIPVPDDGEDDLLAPAMTQDEVRAFIDGLPRSTPIDLRGVAMVELLYGCGLRVSELVALDDGDVDLRARTVHVRDGKGHQQHLLPLMPPALAAVKDYRVVRRMLLRGPDRGALLLSQYGDRLTAGSVRDWFHDLNEARGPEARRLHPHAFRHAFATHLLQGGADIRVVQAALNHARIDTTMRYLRLVPGRLKEEYDKAMPEIAVGL